MKILITVLWIMAVNVCFAGSLTKYDIYISVTGNDKNSGIKENQVQSIKKAKELIRSKAGKEEVQVIFADGISNI